MSTTSTPDFPPVLRDLFALGLDWYSDHHVDLDLLSDFVSAPDVARWWHAWGADTADAVPDFLLFARDGTAGQLGIWRRDPSAAIEREPVVFFGSEGELAVLASSVLEFVALLANGLGPIEVVYPGDKPQPIAAVEQLCARTAARVRCRIPSPSSAVRARYCQCFARSLMQSFDDAPADTAG